MSEPRRTIDDLVWHLEDSHIASPGVKEAIIAKLRAAEELAETVDDAVIGDNYTPELAGALHAYRKAGETK